MQKARGVTLAGGLLAAGLATAATNGFYVPSFRGTPGSSVAGWDQFTVGVGAPGNRPDLAGSTATPARLTQFDPAGFVTGGGNIYNQPNASVFSVTYNVGTPVDQVVFQTRSVGAELDYSSVQLSYAGGAAPLLGIRTELERGPFVGQGPGAIVSSAWTWSLAGLGASDLTISFRAAEPSLSFDSATLDVKTVPEPGTWALLVTGMAVGWGLSRRRSSGAAFKA